MARNYVFCLFFDRVGTSFLPSPPQRFSSHSFPFWPHHLNIIVLSAALSIISNNSARHPFRNSLYFSFFALFHFSRCLFPVSTYYRRRLQDRNRTREFQPFLRRDLPCGLSTHCYSPTARYLSTEIILIIVDQVHGFIHRQAVFTSAHELSR